LPLYWLKQKTIPEKNTWGFLPLGGVRPISAVCFYLSRVFLSQNYGFPSRVEACVGRVLTILILSSPSRSVPPPLFHKTRDRLFACLLGGKEDEEERHHLLRRRSSSSDESLPLAHAC